MMMMMVIKIDMDVASIVEPPPPEMLADIPDGGYGW